MGIGPEILHKFPVIWGIDPHTGLPVVVTPGESHPGKMNLLYNGAFTTDPVKEWYFTEDGGATWRRVEDAKEVIEQTQVVIG